MNDVMVVLNVCSVYDVNGGDVENGDEDVKYYGVGGDRVRGRE